MAYEDRFIHQTHQHKKPMAKVKLDLKGKNDGVLREFAEAHKAAMVGNANFPTPNPTPAVFDAALLAYTDKMDEIMAAEIALSTLRTQREDLRVGLETALNTRGSYVEAASGGDEAKILSAGFAVQAAGSATTSLIAPYNVAASLGDNEGEIDLTWNAIPKAKSYLVEVREHSDTAAPGTWAFAKVAPRSSASVGGLVTGRKYAFRIRAVGPNDIESPWSGEAISLAP